MHVQSSTGARIYAFPVGGRRGQAVAAVRPPVGERKAERPVNIVVGSAWYHDVAIREDDATRRS